MDCGANDMTELRKRLVAVALEWERAFVNIPSITAVISEYDAAMLVGMSEAEYSLAMKGTTSVQRGYDFRHNGLRYQVKGTRPSGKPGSFITKVPGVTNYDWEKLVWISYNPQFEIQEAWVWDVDAYRGAFSHIKRLSPNHLRQGTTLGRFCKAKPALAVGED
jgi:hypothetical protein